MNRPSRLVLLVSSLFAAGWAATPAVVLAAAGLKRLGLESRIRERLAEWRALDANAPKR